MSVEYVNLILRILSNALEEMYDERSYEEKKAETEGSIYCDLFSDGYIRGIEVCYDLIRYYAER